MTLKLLQFHPCHGQGSPHPIPISSSIFTVLLVAFTARIPWEKIKAQAVRRELCGLVIKMIIFSHRFLILIPYQALTEFPSAESQQRTML